MYINSNYFRGFILPFLPEIPPNLISFFSKTNLVIFLRILLFETSGYGLHFITNTSLSELPPMDVYSPLNKKMKRDLKHSATKHRINKEKPFLNSILIHLRVCKSCMNVLCFQSWKNFDLKSMSSYSHALIFHFTMK